jgi:type II secretory pathway component PulM
MKALANAAALWRERSLRERSVLLVAAALALAAALYAFLWEPGLAARKSLASSLPQLRAQLDDMRRQRAEIAVLRKSLVAAPRQGDLGTLLRASVAQTPFAASLERIDALPDGRVRMQAASVPFGAWLTWIEGLQRELGIRVVAARIGAMDQPGLVRLDATFAGARPAAAGSTQ